MALRLRKKKGQAVGKQGMQGAFGKKPVSMPTQPMGRMGGLAGALQKFGKR